MLESGRPSSARTAVTCTGTTPSAVPVCHWGRADCKERAPLQRPLPDCSAGPPQAPQGTRQSDRWHGKKLPHILVPFWTHCRDTAIDVKVVNALQSALVDQVATDEGHIVAQHIVAQPRGQGEEVRGALSLQGDGVCAPGGGPVWGIVDPSLAKLGQHQGSR